MEKDSNLKNLTKNKYLVAGLVLAVFLVGFGAFFAVVAWQARKFPAKTGIVNFTPDDLENANQGGAKEVLRPNFDYVVKEVRADLIVVEGKNGEMYLSKDPNITSVYAGLSKESPKMSVDQLKVGDRVKIEAVPGEKVWIFVYQM